MRGSAGECTNASPFFVLDSVGLLCYFFSTALMQNHRWRPMVSMMP